MRWVCSVLGWRAAERRHELLLQAGQVGVERELARPGLARVEPMEKRVLAHVEASAEYEAEVVQGCKPRFSLLEAEAIVVDRLLEDAEGLAAALDQVGVHQAAVLGLVGVILVGGREEGARI